MSELFEVTRDSDQRRTDLFVARTSGRFYLADDAKTLCLSLSDARKLVEALMAETMKFDLTAFLPELQDAEDG